MIFLIASVYGVWCCFLLNIHYLFDQIEMAGELAYSSFVH